MKGQKGDEHSVIHKIGAAETRAAFKRQDAELPKQIIAREKG